MSNIQLTEVKFILYVQDMDRAIQFYRDVIGLEVKSSSPHWSELKFKTSIVALHSGGTGKFYRTGLSFTVSDIKGMVRNVSDNGGTVHKEPEDRGDEGIFLADVTDTEGNGFMLSQNKN